MGYWTDPVGSGRRKPASKKVKIDPKSKCGVCGKATCRCTRTDVTRGKEKVVIKDKNGRSRTVTRNEPFTTDGRGNQWCGTCSCRVMSGRCTNVTCSTRK